MKKQLIFIMTVMIILGNFTACSDSSKNQNVYHKENSNSENNTVSDQVTQEDKISQEAKLHKIFQNHIVAGDNEINFLCADYDNNGTLEAFGVSTHYESDSADECIANLYFINDKGNCEDIPYIKNEDSVVETWVKNEFVGDGETVGHEEEKFFVWTENFGGPGSWAHVFGVKDGRYFRTNISGKVEDFGVADDGMYAGTTSFFRDIDDPEFAGREWILHYYKYDGNIYEFIEMHSEPADI